MQSVNIGVLLFLLTSLTLADTTLAGTFVETFDNKDLNKWQEIIQHDAAPGSWEVIDGELHAISLEGFTRLLTIGDETWRSYTIEFDVKPLKKHGPGNIAVAARIKRTWAVWCVVGDLAFPALRPEFRASCFAGNLHSDKALFLGSKPHPSLKLNKWSHLKLSVHGNLFTFWINGKQVLDPLGVPELRDLPEPLNEFPNFSTGRAGLGLSNHTARFDNIMITGDSIPDRGGLSVKPRGKLTKTWGSLKGF